MVPLAGITLNEMPAQAVAVISEITGVGNTVTVTVNDAPLPQMLVFGITV